MFDWGEPEAPKMEKVKTAQPKAADDDLGWG